MNKKIINLANKANKSKILKKETKKAIVEAALFFDTMDRVNAAESAFVKFLADEKISETDSCYRIIRKAFGQGVVFHMEFAELNKGEKE